MLRQLISKWGIMSIEMEKAYTADGGIIGDNGSVEYVGESDISEPQPDIIEAEPVQEVQPTQEDTEPNNDDEFDRIMKG